MHFARNRFLLDFSATRRRNQSITRTAVDRSSRRHRRRRGLLFYKCYRDACTHAVAAGTDRTRTRDSTEFGRRVRRDRDGSALRFRMLRCRRVRFIDHHRRMHGGLFERGDAAIPPLIFSSLDFSVFGVFFFLFHQRLQKSIISYGL